MEEQQRIEKVKTDYLETKKAELTKFRLLRSKADRWQQTKILRDYINAIEETAIENDQLTEELTGWLEWSKKKTDWYDPMIESFDVLLDDVNRDELSK